METYSKEEKELVITKQVEKRYCREELIEEKASLQEKLDRVNNLLKECDKLGL